MLRSHVRPSKGYGPFGRGVLGHVASGRRSPAGQRCPADPMGLLGGTCAIEQVKCNPERHDGDLEEGARELPLPKRDAGNCQSAIRSLGPGSLAV